MTYALLMPQTDFSASPPFLRFGRRSRNTLLQMAVLAACLGVSMGQAQGIYKSVGPDGRVTFSDRPVLQSGQRMESAPTAASASPPADNASLPYALRQAASRYPVALYSAKDCQPCDEARRFLQARGIPFAEWLVETSADQAALQKLSGQNSLPFATIGQQHLNGFAENIWGEYLSAAGYPAKSQLSTGYQPPPAAKLTKPLAEEQPLKQAATDTPAEATRPATTPPPGSTAADNPAGLRF